MARNVYALLCHSADDHILDLFRYLYRRDDWFVLHIDAKASPRLHAVGHRLQERYSNVAVVESRLCSWGGYSLVRATFAMMSHAVRHFGEWDHFTLLSESHLPLWPSAKIAEMQPEATSWISTELVARLDVNGQADVAQRFSRFYRELPGVGSFACHDRTFPADLAAKLYHGSQWVSLSHKVCNDLLIDNECTLILAALSTSLLSDELAIPTMMMATQARLGNEVLQKNPTYVAWPHLGASIDMIFADANFFAARADGHLFIRKRPSQMTPAVSAIVEEFAFCTVDELEGQLGELPDKMDLNPIAIRGRLTGDALSKILEFHFPQYNIERFDPLTSGNTPSLFFKLSGNQLRDELSVSILSADSDKFKLVLMWMGSGLSPHNAPSLGIYKTAMLKVRVHTLAYFYEVLLENPYQFGFVQLSTSNLDNLLEPVIYYLEKAQEISDYLTTTDPY